MQAIRDPFEQVFSDELGQPTDLDYRVRRGVSKYGARLEAGAQLKDFQEILYWRGQPSNGGCRKRLQPPVGVSSPAMADDRWVDQQIQR